MFNYDLHNKKSNIIADFIYVRPLIEKKST